uniref:Uncharacterized protein n=1 Tax=Nelumbo nucifera TaxID=4432 RepID=A0A822XJT6_NELNU|nr:TPA_asm: hypothetical protein HUJ06_020538 [Nelumbo nucifera]
MQRQTAKLGPQECKLLGCVVAIAILEKNPGRSGSTKHTSRDLLVPPQENISGFSTTQDLVDRLLSAEESINSRFDRRRR